MKQKNLIDQLETDVLLKEKRFLEQQGENEELKEALDLQMMSTKSLNNELNQIKAANGILERKIRAE